MTIPNNFKYPLDITGTSITNYIGGELHTITSESSNLLVVRSGAFFTKHTVVYDWLTNEPLELGKDYVFRCFYKEATIACSSEIATVIEIKDPTRTGKFGINTQVVGGEFSYNDAVIIGLLLDLIEDNRNIDWDTIKNKPELWNGAPHMHNADTDIYGTGSITKGLERIASEVALRNVAAIVDPIMEVVDTKVSKHSAIKVGIEDSVYRPTSRVSRMIRVTLPKSTLGHARAIATIQIKEPLGFTNFTFTFNENGSEYEDVVISRHGNSESFWAVKMTTNVVRGTSFDFCTDWIREGKDTSEMTFVVLSYAVEVSDPTEMTGLPIFEEFNSVNGNWSDDDIIYPDIDKRDFVTRNRNRMLEATSPFANFQTLGSNDTFNAGDSSLFAIRFPLVLENTPLNFTLKFEVDILSGSNDKGAFVYTVTGTYYRNSKFTIKAVNVDGQLGKPLQVMVADSFDGQKSNFFVIKSTEINATIKGRVSILSMEVDVYSRDTWIEEWGVALTKDEIDENLNAGTLTYSTVPTTYRDINENASYQKLFFNNAMFCPDNDCEGVGVKLLIPALKTRLEARNVPMFAYGEPTENTNSYAMAVYNGFNGNMPIHDLITVELVVTSKLSDTTRYTDIYTITYSALLKDLSVVRIGNSENNIKFSIDGKGAIHMHGLPNWADSVIWVKSILLLMTDPETYTDTLDWKPRTEQEQTGNSGMISSIDTTTPRLEKLLNDTAEALTKSMDDLEESLTQAITILTKDLEVVTDDVNALKSMVVQPGMVIGWTGETVPTGYISYSGQAFNKAEFVKLAVLYPSGRMPNFEDDFLRGVSEARTVLSKQGQSVQPLGFSGNKLPNHGHTVGTEPDGSGGGGSISTGPHGAVRNWPTNSVSAGTPTGTITGTGDETRPRNSAVIWITLKG